MPPNPPTIFRIAPTSTYYSNFVADWIVNGLKAKKVGQVTDTTDYGTGALQARPSRNPSVPSLAQDAPVLLSGLGCAVRRVVPGPDSGAFPK